MSSQNNTLVLTLCAILAPAGFVFGSRYIGQGPASAMASAIDRPDLPSELPVLKPVSARESRDSNEPIQSPFYIETMAQVGTVPPPAKSQSRPTRPVQAQTLPTVSVTSILPNSRNPLAVIDGRPRRVGDTLPSGWTVISINGEDNTVTLKHSSGAEIRAGLKNGS